MQSTHYDRDDVALSGFHKFLKDMSEKKKENADKLMQKQNERGGRVTFQDVQVKNIKNKFQQKLKGGLSETYPAPPPNPPKKRY